MVFFDEIFLGAWTAASDLVAGLGTEPSTAD